MLGEVPHGLNRRTCHLRGAGWDVHTDGVGAASHGNPVEKFTHRPRLPISHDERLPVRVGHHLKGCEDRVYRVR